MATKANTTRTTRTATKGKAAPAPTVATGNASTGTGTPAPQAPAQAPQAPLFTVGNMPPVQPGSIRAYAQQVARQCAKAHPGGFTLGQYRAALVASAQGSTCRQPTHGWAKHNMPTWAAQQGWLVPASS